MENEQGNINNQQKEAVISIQNLSKTFGNNSVLRGINIEVHKGENVVVLGRSGSGKSVLLKIIAGLLKPDEGKVVVLGRNVSTLNTRELQELRMHIGFSFQGSALYDGMSVRENLEFPLVRNKRKLSKKQVNEAVTQVLNDVGLLQTIHQMPSELSGGQKKRISIARTLILQPEIILYDEPTGGINPITCVELNHLIIKVQKQYNTSSMIITHDLTCARMTGNRVAMLIDGKILRQGSFTEVFNTDDVSIKGFYNYNFLNQK
jgi:phospholipid/cholesterol/gamma-HCH transport system ATP-binding protein